MLSEIEKQRLSEIKREICQRANAGDDASPAEEFQAAVNRFRLTPEQARHLDVLLIRACPGYHGQHS